MTTSNANPTVSTPAPVLTDAVQRCVDTAAEAIATQQRSKINLYARSSEKNTKGKHTGNLQVPPLAGTSLAQSVFTGIPSTSRGPYPSFVTHPNYHDGQFHHYLPNPFPQSPATSAPTNYPFCRDEY